MAEKSFGTCSVTDGKPESASSAVPEPAVAYDAC